MTAVTTEHDLAITLGVEEEFFLVDIANAASTHNFEGWNTWQ